VVGQAERILSLDLDLVPLHDAARDDAVLERLLAERPGLRPPLFGSAYEAAAWAVLSSRTGMAQAAVVRDRLTAEHGSEVEVGGRALRTFPPPESLLAAGGIQGVSTEKQRRLHAVAEAALDGSLSAPALRALPAEQAVASLRSIHGIGPFGADLVLIRAVGLADHLPEAEPRARRAAASAYGLSEVPEGEAWRAFAERWRPYRAVVCFLLRSQP
jgi:DNA-3-methyladenine glycosylase II